MSDFIERELSASMADRDLAFVFPSQAAADAWALEAPRRLGLRAVENDRFIGWDSFKEELFSPRRAERPADRLARILWAAGIVERQGREPFLRRLVGPGRPSPAFVPFLAAIPPALDGVVRAIGSRAGTAPPPDHGPGTEAPRDGTWDDLLALHADYSRFLAEKGLFEPSWEKRPAGASRRRHLVVAPELIEDFAEYEEALAGIAPRVRLLRLPATAAPPPLLSFPGLAEELRWAFLSIGERLDGGERPEDIAVTMAGLEEARPWVERAARDAGVPVAFRSGEPLSRSPFGRLLSRVKEAADADFGFDAMRALILDRFLPWKEEATARGLLRLGIERHAYAPWTKDGRRIDAWEASLTGLPGARGLASFHRRLRAALLALSGARDFAALGSAVSAFRLQFLDESALPEAEERRIQRAMAELEGLARAEEDLGARGRVPEPFALYLRVLDGATYMPQGGGAAVSVWPYRVSALLPARVHYVLGCSQDGLRVAYAGARFLREDQKLLLGSVDRDASADFARAYALSGESLAFAHAVEDLGGWSAPHPFFEGGGAHPEAEAAAALRDTDPLLAEAAAWRGSAPFPGRILGLQRSAFLSALPSLRAAPPRLDRVPASAPARQAALARNLRPDGLLRLSSTHLEEYRACPFAWLLARGLRLEEEPSGIAFFDARLQGEMAHAALELLLAEIGRLGPIDGGRIEEYRGLARRAARAVLPRFVATEGPFLEPMFEAYAPLLEDRFLRLVDKLCADGDRDPGELERRIEKAYPGLGVMLEGQIDRIFRHGAGYAIVDYKKRSLPRRKDLAVAAVAEEGSGGEPAGGDDGEEGAAAPGELGSLQIAAYVSLAESAAPEGERVEKAAYWSIEDARELLVFGGEGERSRSDYGPELAAFERVLAEVAAGLRAGSFPPAGPGSPACAGCPWRGSCRARFATE